MQIPLLQVCSGVRFLSSVPSTPRPNEILRRLWVGHSHCLPQHFGDRLDGTLVQLFFFICGLRDFCFPFLVTNGGHVRPWVCVKRVRIRSHHGSGTELEKIQFTIILDLNISYVPYLHPLTNPFFKVQIGETMRSASTAIFIVADTCKY